MPGFNVMFVVSLVIFVLMFAFIIGFIFSPKLRGKMMSRQVKSLKYMADYSKDDLESAMTTLGNVSVNTRSKIINKNEDKLKEMADKTANISKDAITTTVGAIKKGIKDNIYCKHCGELIDKDSKFCKHCGKEQ